MRIEEKHVRELRVAPQASGVPFLCFASGDLNLFNARDTGLSFIPGMEGFLRLDFYLAV